MSKLNVKQICEDDLFAFATLLNPNHLYGEIHKEVFKWMSGKNRRDNILILLPRAHLKSHMVAVWCAWWITKHPEVTILYASATEDLANAQLSAIKGMLESPIYRKYWPEMINAEEAKREKWSATEIKVDHPRRKEFGVRDATVAARSIKGNTTGAHCDVLVLDDIVVPANAYTEEGRRNVAAGYSQFSSVKNPGSKTLAVGTRYHPSDIYNSMSEMMSEEYDEDGNIVGEDSVYDIYQKAVIEEEQFIWPREQHPKTKKWYGFNNQVLAKIKSEYHSVGESAQFAAQYYNDPNDPDSQRLDYSKFQHYDQKYLTYRSGSWYFKNQKLAVYAAADVAYTTGQKSDYTAIAVVGVTADNMIYVLEVLQFKSDKYDEFYSTILTLYLKWKFKRIQIETQAGGALIAQYIKDQARKEGQAIVVEHKMTTGQNKKERIAAVLEPKYETQSLWHYRGGYMGVLEEQLVLARPSHDDLKDALAMAVSFAKPPALDNSVSIESNVVTVGRFGGWKRA